MKLKFLLRIDSNGYTKQLAVALVEHKQEGSFTTNIAYDLQLSNYDYDTLLNVAILETLKLMTDKLLDDMIFADKSFIIPLVFTFKLFTEIFNILAFPLTNKLFNDTSEKLELPSTVNLPDKLISCALIL